MTMSCKLIAIVARAATLRATFEAALQHEPESCSPLTFAKRAKPGECRKKKRDRHDQADEEAEDAELLADEEGEGANGRGTRLTAQPSVIQGGTMREYQMQGLNWLIHLYDNGINGILADEMVRLRTTCARAWCTGRAICVASTMPGTLCGTKLHEPALQLV